MRKKIIAANWKMNMTLNEAASFLDTFLRELGDEKQVEGVIIPQQNFDDQAVFDSLDRPLRAVQTRNGTGIAEPEAFITPNFGERDTQVPRTHKLDEPVPTITGHGAGMLVGAATYGVTTPGKPYVIVSGTVTGFNAAGTRLRYNANSRDGSSGAPCLNADLRLVGLHHAHDPAYPPAWNQAIPVGLIQAEWRDRGVAVP